MNNTQELIAPFDALLAASAGGVFLDVRSPGESTAAPLPCGVNAGILSNIERDTVGRIYKQRGSEEAIRYGNWFVQGKRKATLIDKWISLIQKDNITGIYCARGGLRSQITQQWLSESGTALPRVKGGYKALRQELIAYAHNPQLSLPLLALTGHTGCGKTRLIHTLSSHHRTIDLEDMARHRGSAFGDTYKPQPTQIEFENSLYLSILRETITPLETPILIEDESRMIGKRELPDPFFQRMCHSPRIQLERPMKERIQIILEEYIVEEQERLLGLYRDPEVTCSLLSSNLCEHLKRIARKLGGARFQELTKDIQDACKRQALENSPEYHTGWIHKLLLWYYDPLYEKHLNKISPLIVARAHPDELVASSKSLLTRLLKESSWKRKEPLRGARNGSMMQ
ncbi:tRNA 2-selenouridine(34) synthase MnmH [bacterium]|nr:tRNA 2-selenouridine(34) synthase MnmH [bacterium]